MLNNKNATRPNCTTLIHPVLVLSHSRLEKRKEAPSLPGFHEILSKINVRLSSLSRNKRRLRVGQDWKELQSLRIFPENNTKAVHNSGARYNVLQLPWVEYEHRICMDGSASIGSRDDSGISRNSKPGWFDCRQMFNYTSGSSGTDSAKEETDRCTMIHYHGNPYQIHKSLDSYLVYEGVS